MRYCKNGGKTKKKSWKTGLLSGKMGVGGIGGTNYNASALTVSDKILLWDRERDICTDAAESAEYVTFYEAHAAYILPQRAELFVGSDGKLPLRLFYLEFPVRREKAALDFHLTGPRGIVPDSKVLEKHAEGARLFSDPDDPDKRTVFCFGLKDVRSCAFVQGVFKGSRAGVFYRALEKYDTPDRVRAAILSQSAVLRKKLASSRVKDLLLEKWASVGSGAEERLLRASLLAKHFPEISASEIRFACSGQEIDGSGAGNGLLPLSLLAFLEAGGDEKLLSEELPYRYDGGRTKKKETVFWHAMRAAEHAESREGLAAAGKLCSLCRQDGLGRVYDLRKSRAVPLARVLGGGEGVRLPADRAFFCQCAAFGPIGGK